MLYNKDWDKSKTKPDVFSLESLIAWLETMPADQYYKWFDVHSCLLCQYLQAATGSAHPARENGGFGQQTIKNWGKRGYHDICGTEPYTFGAALDRARASLQKGAE